VQSAYLQRLGTKGTCVAKKMYLRILLVENSEHDFLAFKRAFQGGRMGSDITRYVRAEEALERLMADAASFDLVVTEYKLPGISGPEFCRELIERKVSLPRVLLTGAESEKVFIEAIKAGFDDILRKDSDQGYPGLLPLMLWGVVTKYGYHQRIRREEEERKSQAPSETISADLAEMVRRFLPDKTLTFVNDAYCGHHSKRREELIGQSFMPFIHEEDQQRVEKHFTSFNPEAPTKVVEHRIVLSTGEVRWQKWTDHAIFDEKSRLSEFQSVGLDITEFKQMEGSLHQSEDRYRLLVENVLDGFFVCEPKSGAFLLINKRACDLFGYTMQEALTRSIWDMLVPEEHMILEEGIRARLEGKEGSVLHDRYRMLRKDGEKFSAELSASLVFFRGERVLQGIFRDLTEQESYRMPFEKAYQPEGFATLSSGIAHRFNNALATITENIGRLESAFPSSENTGEYVEPIYDAARQMSRLSSRLLAYAGARNHKREILSLNAVVEETLSLVEHIIDPAIQVESIFGDDVLSVEADVAKLQLKLAALLANIMEAMEGQGRIRIITKNEEIDGELASRHPALNPGLYVCLTLEVDVKGLDEKRRNRLLESISWVRSQGRILDSGAVQDIMMNDVGLMLVDSAMEKGVTVRLYFPAVTSKEALLKQPLAQQATDKGTALVVEDEETATGMTQTLLKKLGYHVLEANTGLEAVNFAKTFRGDIDLALLDVVLPDMGGKEVYALLREARPNLKVIVFVEYENDALAQKILDAGAQAVIQKPLTLATLSAKLKEISGNE
jgi:two-component system cell cycle sensor histidine kinase/response regulator CckA